MNRIFLFVLLFLSASSNLTAKHIIGGSMTYKYLGPGASANTNKYEFTLTVFRDCNSGGADFDFNAIITIYEQIGNTYITKNDYTFGVPLTKSNKIPLQPQPCMTLPDVCVETGEYVFTRELPITGNSFHVSYQRCCRNETISNLVSPGTIGATYTIEVTNAAMLAKSSSPTFKDLPPIVICNEIPIFYDHSAEDIDGDLLIYSFCSPIDGGGNIDSGSGSTGCEGVTPNPGCPPPFDLAPFVQPAYSPTKPMGGNPVVSINSNSGLITGITHQLGQYVVSVCVKEYRSGQLLSTIQREFQFNVTDCQADLIANIKSDTTIGFKSYQLTSCGQYDFQFNNFSTGNGINNYYWEFNLNNGQIATSIAENAIISFPDTGYYVGKMVLNQGSPCSDSLKVAINIYGGAIASFSYDYDTCVAGPVQFADASTSEAFLVNWTWDFGDGNTDKVKTPAYLYKDPGIYPVSLKVEDGNGCIGDTTAIITWQPAPSDVIIAPSTFKGCLPADIFFDNLSNPIDSTYTMEWDFGDGESDSLISPTHTFKEIGIYSVNVKIISPIGCEAEKYFPNWIQVLPSPKAMFSYSPDKITSFNPTIDFVDESEDAIKWFWNFDSLATTQEVNPTYAFQDTGKHLVGLRVVHESGCVDTITRIIDLVPEITFFMPNAFTPNEDTKNDIFKGKGNITGISDFQMVIWNRWGEQVFQTTDIETGWNGSKFNEGNPSPPGVYVYEVSYTNPRGKDFYFRGFATLIR